MLQILGWIPEPKAYVQVKESLRDLESWRQLQAKLGSHTFWCAILDHLVETPNPNFSHCHILFGIAR